MKKMKNIKLLYFTKKYFLLTIFCNLIIVCIVIMIIEEKKMVKNSFIISSLKDTSKYVLDYYWANNSLPKVLPKRMKFLKYYNNIDKNITYKIFSKNRFSLVYKKDGKKLLGNNDIILAVKINKQSNFATYKICADQKMLNSLKKVKIKILGRWERSFNNP